MHKEKLIYALIDWMPFMLGKIYNKRGCQHFKGECFTKGLNEIQLVNYWGYQKILENSVDFVGGDWDLILQCFSVRTEKNWNYNLVLMNVTLEMFPIQTTQKCHFLLPERYQFPSIAITNHSQPLFNKSSLLSLSI